VDLKDRDNKSDVQKLKITSLENDVRNFTQQADRMKNTNDQLNNQIIQLNEKVKLLNMNISELERKVTFILFLSLI
jgi:peptidoglycan hydrolase CwlO-like protein